MKATKKGGPLAGAGVIGRLGDLATIAPEYDIAVSTACGSLENIVCETLQGCELCVKFLRDTNAGRASFIALSEMGQWRDKMASRRPAPTGVSRLIDLISPKDDRYLPAFYMAMRDTLVATNLDAATRIA